MGFEKLLFGLAAITLFMSISCNDAVVVYQEPSLSIVGNWDWIQSVGMFGLVTPESVQISRIFEFDNDSTFYDHFMRWSGDTTITQWTYRFEFSSENTAKGTLIIGGGGGRGGGNTFFVTFTNADEITTESAGVESETSIFRKRSGLR